MTGRLVTEEETHGMVVLHRIFRRGFATVAESARDVDPRDTGRVRAIGEYAAFLINGLHHHHSAEDDVLWPALLERAPGDSELTHRMESQHAEVATWIAAVRADLDTWAAQPDGPALAADVEGLSTALAPHLDEEESRILPLMQEHIFFDEWKKAGDAAFAAFTTGEKFTALGQMLDSATPEESRMFLEGLPAPVMLIWRLVGRRRYERMMGQVTGRAA